MDTTAENGERKNPGLDLEPNGRSQSMDVMLHRACPYFLNIFQCCYVEANWFYYGQLWYVHSVVAVRPSSLIILPNEC